MTLDPTTGLLMLMALLDIVLASLLLVAVRQLTRKRDDDFEPRAGIMLTEEERQQFYGLEAATDPNNTIGHNLEGLDDSVRHMDQHFDPQPFIADGKWVKEL